MKRTILALTLVLFLTNMAFANPALADIYVEDLTPAPMAAGGNRLLQLVLGLLDLG